MSLCFPSIFYIFISIYIYYLAYQFKFSWKLKLITLVPLLYSLFLYYVCDKSKIVAWLLIPVPFVILKKVMTQYFLIK